MGFKKSSGVIAVSGRIEESGVNTFTETEIDLALDALNNEVFVVLAIDSDLSPPDFIPGTNSQALMQLSTTRQLDISGIESTNVMTRNERVIQSPAAGSTATWEHRAGEQPQAVLDYLQIISTPSFYAQIEGVNNTNPMACAFRVWGYRAKADSATYAALVQSEVLSS